MKLIFDHETELGLCDPDKINGHFGDDPGAWVALVHTTAAVTSAKGMLRIEQRCYIRSTERAEDVRSQSWIKPEMTLEPVLGSREETTGFIQQLHEQFVQRARDEFMTQSLLVPDAGLCQA